MVNKKVKNIISWLERHNEDVKLILKENKRLSEENKELKEEIKDILDKFQKLKEMSDKE